jgi:hypothetical protein
MPNLSSGGYSLTAEGYGQLIALKLEAAMGPQSIYPFEVPLGG